MTRRLGVGFIGSGFMTRFHIHSWQAVRDGDVRGVWSPIPVRAGEAVALARELGSATRRAFATMEAMVADPAIDCIWICGPNHTRIENMERIVDALERGAAAGRHRVREAAGAQCRRSARGWSSWSSDAGLLHGYLENQLFAPAVERGKADLWARGAAMAGRPYLARAAEEHSGPHMPWFWRGDLQGGGVLNDMMCHSLEVGRYLLTKPGAPRDSIRPAEVSAQIATPKWTRPEYAELLQRDDGRRRRLRARPAEDFARATVNYEDEDGQPLIVEATTSWSFVGAGLRLTMELLGPEYSMSMQHPRQRHQGLPFAPPCAGCAAKTWSRSRTPSRG